MKIIPAEQKHQKHMLGMLPYIIIYIYIFNHHLCRDLVVSQKKVVSQCEGVLSSPELQISIPRRCSFLSYQDVSTFNMNTHTYIYIYVYIMKLWLLLIYYYYTNTCSETSYRITDWCGMHRTCKNTSVNLTGAIGWSGVKTYAKDIIQLVLMQPIHSQKTVEVQIAKTVQKGIGRPIGRHAGSWLGRSPFLNIDIEKNEAGTSRWSAVISACTVAASLDHRSQYMDGPPAVNVRVANCHDAKNPKNQKPNKLQ